MIFKKFFQSFNQAKAKILIINSLVVVLLLNLMASRIGFHLDLTQNKIHSLSPASKKVLTDLDDIVNLEVFISEQIPTQLINLKNTLVWLIQDYQKNAPGKIRVRFLDPNKDQQARERATQLGISPIEFSTLKRDKFEVSRGWLALTVSYGDKTEVINAVQNLSNLEYRLTAALKKVTQKKLKTIAFSYGHGETDLNQISLAQKALSKNYEWQIISLKGEKVAFNPQVAVLIIVDPREKFSPKEKEIIDRYIQEGKGVLFLLDKEEVSQTLQTSQNSPQLDDLLSHYGISLEDKLVLDQAAALAGFRTNEGEIIIPYPYWIQISPQGFNHQLPPVANLNALTLIWASPLKLSQGADWLVKTSPRAWSDTTPFNLDPTQKFLPPEKREQFVLATIQTKNIPPFSSKTTVENKEEKKIKLAVIGDADFIKDNFVKSHRGNLQFFSNLVDFLAQEKDLIAIRSKPVISRPLKPLNQQLKQAVKLANFLSPVLMAAVFFLLVKIKRRDYLKKKIKMAL